MMFKECINSTRKLLYKRGILVDKSNRIESAYMLIELNTNNKLGYYEVNRAHEKFITKNEFNYSISNYKAK